MQDFVQIIKQVTQKPMDNAIDDHYENIRKQGAKVFVGTTNPMVAEEWLKNTKRVLNQIDYTPEKRSTMWRHYSNKMPWTSGIRCREVAICQ